MKGKADQVTVGEVLEGLKDEDKDLKVVYSIDDEGNDFRPVFYTPNRGYLLNGSFVECDGLDDLPEEEKKAFKEMGQLVVCLN